MRVLNVKYSVGFFVLSFVCMACDDYSAGYHDGFEKKIVDMRACEETSCDVPEYEHNINFSK